MKGSQNNEFTICRVTILLQNQFNLEFITFDEVNYLCIEICIIKIHNSDLIENTQLDVNTLPIACGTFDKFKWCTKNWKNEEFIQKGGRVEFKQGFEFYKNLSPAHIL